MKFQATKQKNFSGQRRNFHAKSAKRQKLQQSLIKNHPQHLQVHQRIFGESFRTASSGSSYETLKFHAKVSGEEVDVLHQGLGIWQLRISD